MWFIKVIQELNRSKVEYAIAGGYAVALHGAVRGTVDIDLVLVLTEKNLLAAEKALMNLNLQSRIPVTAKEIFNFRKEYLQKRNLIAWSFVDSKDPSRVVDLILTDDLKKLSSVKKKMAGLQVPVLSIKSLIQMKKAAGRPQDLEDVKALEEINEKN
jgi:hypothetical protein